jgi:hypothetical protein
MPSAVLPAAMSAAASTAATLQSWNHTAAGLSKHSDTNKMQKASSTGVHPAHWAYTATPALNTTTLLNTRDLMIQVTPCAAPQLEESPVLAASAAHDAVICVEAHAHQLNRVIEQLHEAVVVTGSQVLAGFGPASHKESYAKHTAG